MTTVTEICCPVSTAMGVPRVVVVNWLVLLTPVVVLQVAGVVVFEQPAMRVSTFSTEPSAPAVAVPLRTSLPWFGPEGGIVIVKLRNMYGAVEAGSVLSTK